MALVAWSRRSEITADRAGLLCRLNIEEAEKALLPLQSGFVDANQSDINNYVQNSKHAQRMGPGKRSNGRPGRAFMRGFPKHLFDR